MRIFHLLTTITVLMLMVSCQREFVIENSNVPATNYVDIPYGIDPQQTMDFYLPAGRSVAATKVIVMIHGGSWSSGDKADLKQFVDTLKRRVPEYALVNINYRLSAFPANLFPAQENDVKAAIEFIYSKGAEYFFSSKYVLIGVSAGAHLAMLQGYKNTSPVKPKAIVSFSGPSDLTDMYNNPAGGNPLLSVLIASVVGKTPTQDPLLYTNSSPVSFITADTPPTLLLHGDTDPIVKYSQAELVKTKLQATGVVNQYVLYMGSGHLDTWTNEVFFDSFNTIQAFLTANVL